MTTPLPAGPQLINFFKPILFMASDSSSGFRQGYHTFLYGHLKYNWEGGIKRTNEQTWTWISSKCKKGESIWHFPYSLLCIWRLSRACILRETSTKATWNANSSLTVFLHCLLLQTVLPLDCYPGPTGLFCSPLSTASPRLPLSTDSLCIPWDLPSFLDFLSRPQSFLWISRKSR